MKFQISTYRAIEIANYLENYSLLHTLTYIIWSHLQRVSHPPRYTLIDVCPVSKPRRFKITWNVDCWLSDFHNFHMCNYKMRMPRQLLDVLKYRSYKNFDPTQFQCDLYILSGLLFTQISTLCTQTFVNHLTNVIKVHRPLKLWVICHKNVPYMNAELRKLQYKQSTIRNLKSFKSRKLLMLPLTAKQMCEAEIVLTAKTFWATIWL